MMRNMESVSAADIDARVNFIRRTYAHLMGAIFALIGLEFALFQAGVPEMVVPLMLSGGQMGWLVVLGLFMVVGWIADRWARSDVSSAMQYAGLGLYVAAQAILLVPLLYIAVEFSEDRTVIPMAAITTLTVFAGLTVAVFATKKDFSFLRMGLAVGGFLAIGAIIAAALFGFTLGLLFSVLMVGFAAAYILYTTSNILHHYRTDQHVAASLALFAAVALLFWYILQIFMSRN